MLPHIDDKFHEKSRKILNVVEELATCLSTAVYGRTCLYISIVFSLTLMN